jgi:phytoene dehydrogenase-like protein
MQTPEIIVIGGGLGGLCSAALLARSGHRVRLLEQASTPGGRARSRQERGFTHNLGAHALYQGGPAVEVLHALGVRPAGRLVGGRGGYLLQADQLHVLPRNPWTALTTGALGARGKLLFGKLLLSVGENKAQRLRGVSVQQWLDAEAPDARARAVVETFIRLTTYAHAPELLSAEVAVRQLAIAARQGVMYVDGGWQTLVDAVRHRAEQAGVQIETGVAVASIEHDSQVSAVVTRDGRRLPARAVVAAVEPRALAALLAQDARAERWADSAIPLRAACLDLGVRGLPHPERVNVLCTDAPLYFANHSAYAALAPEGASTLHLARYLAPGEDGRNAEAELRDFLERVQPGVYARAEVKRFMPSLTVHNDIPGRAQVQLVHPEIAGLCIVGDFAARSAILLDGVLQSARAAAERLSADDLATPARSRDAERAA